jgi:hypothetical protein
LKVVALGDVAHCNVVECPDGIWGGEAMIEQVGRGASGGTDGFRTEIFVSISVNAPE